VAELPRGTVTFLFTDVEGSTRLLHELGDRYADVLAEHRRALRDCFARHGGVEVDTQGDAFFVAFAKASHALAAARDGRDALAEGPIRVRIGIHTGEPVVTEEGYVGVDVHRAARIAAAGHGGQILVSQTTRELCGADGLRDLGEHRLKDLTAPERIYQLEDDDFPPLKTLYRTNLPVVATPLVGRGRELEETGALVRSNRLLTLTGPGGSGKTRLAVHLAANAAEDFPDGVFWVPLQAIRDPAIVETAIAAAIGADEGLVTHVGSKRMLVLLDNFEQVIEAASTVAALVSSTPNAKVLVTSREPLHVDGEQRYPVEPLLPDDAEVLFEERAAAVLPGFRSGPEVQVICERLDRLPLAIELAAARVALLDPAQLLARLDQRLPLLATRSRDAPARQRTLRATIEWSYELLEPVEEQLFRRLAAFRGSFSLESAQAVCDAQIDTIESLVVKNLVRRRLGTDRLLLLDTIREYAAECLEQSSEADDVHTRHADYFLDVARNANLSAGKLAPGGQRLDLAFAEQDNFRGALAWAIHHDEIALGLDFATALEQFWVANDAHEGVRWFRRLFEHPESAAVDQDLRAHALRAWGSSTHISGDPPGAERLWEESLAIFEQLGDRRGRAVILHRLSISAMIRGDLARARELVETSHELHATDDDPTAKTWGLAQTTGTLGAIMRDLGDDEEAALLIASSAKLARDAGVPWWRGGMLAELSALALRCDRLAEADAHARESLSIATEVRDRSGRIFGVGLLATVAAERGELPRAGLLWGAIEHEEAFAPVGGWQRHRDACEAMVLRHANDEFERERERGRELELDEAVEEALRSVD
jgi:predicted ATPase/class 3 adenylate cyclase